jgi:hypothetical protein
VKSFLNKTKSSKVFHLRKVYTFPVLGRLRQDGHEFKTSLSYIARPCLKKKKEGRKEGRERGRKGGRKERKKLVSTGLTSSSFVQVSSLVCDTLLSCSLLPLRPNGSEPGFHMIRSGGQKKKKKDTGHWQVCMWLGRN